MPTGTVTVPVGGALRDNSDWCTPSGDVPGASVGVVRGVIIAAAWVLCSLEVLAMSIPPH